MYIPFDCPGTFKVKLVRNGFKIYMFIGKHGMAEGNSAIEVSFREPILVGLAVCSHRADASDTVVFF